VVGICIATLTPYQSLRTRSNWRIPLYYGYIWRLCYATIAAGDF